MPLLLTRFYCDSCGATVTILTSNRHTTLRCVCENDEQEMQRKGFANVTADDDIEKVSSVFPPERVNQLPEVS